jgi:hypothetical protein
MPQQNQIELRIPEADLADIKGAIDILRAKLLPHLKTLSAQDRRKMLKMGDRTVAFVQKAFEYGTRQPKLVPSFLDMESFSRDINGIQLMQELIRGLSPLCEALEDSLMLSGSEAYQGSLLFYQNAKMAARSKDPDAKLIANDLAERFKGARKP